jgi:hypothetical protein
VFSLAMAAWASRTLKSSLLPLAEREVSGVPVLDTDGVVFEDEEFFAAFSARRFCLDADGAMVCDVCGAGCE